MICFADNFHLYLRLERGEISGGLDRASDKFKICNMMRNLANKLELELTKYAKHCLFVALLLLDSARSISFQKGEL